MLENKVVLVTGAAKRVGAAIATKLHYKGMRVIVHYGGSAKEAERLVNELNDIRDDSAVALQADLNDMQAIDGLAKAAVKQWGSLDALVNNASCFYPTKLGEVTEAQWNELFASNAKAPFFLTQALAEELKQRQGVVINMADIHADRPLQNYPVYCMAKAALVMLTKSLAKELGPDIRVNAIAPGVILWPDGEAVPEAVKQSILKRTALQCFGEPQYVADAVAFLIQQPFITGQILAVDGGRSLTT